MAYSLSFFLSLPPPPSPPPFFLHTSLFRTFVFTVTIYCLADSPVPNSLTPTASLGSCPSPPAVFPPRSVHSVHLYLSTRHTLLRITPHFSLSFSVSFSTTSFYTRPNLLPVCSLSLSLPLPLSSRYFPYLPQILMSTFSEHFLFSPPSLALPFVDGCDPWPVAGHSLSPMVVTVMRID